MTAYCAACRAYTWHDIIDANTTSITLACSFAGVEE